MQKGRIPLFKKIKNEKMDVCYRLFPWIWMLVGFVYNIWYQIFPGKFILDADLASEMVLSDLLNSTGDILSTNWYYSTELRVFQSQWFYRLGLLIFPDNWHCARIVAAALMMIIFAAAILFVTYSANMQRFGIWCCAILMWPFGRWYLVYGLYGTYYIVYILFSLVAIASLFVSYKSNNKKTIIGYVIGVFFAFASGLNGIKQTIVFFGPLLVASLFLLFFSIRDKKPYTVKELVSVCKNEVRILIQTIILVGSNLVGYYINSHVLCNKYSYKGFNDLIWAWEPPNKLYDIWLDFLLLFGYQRDIKVVDLWGIVSLLGAVFGMVIGFSIIRLCKHYSRLCLEQRLILLLTISTLLFDALIFCLIGEYKQYYWLPLLPFSIFVLLIEIKTEEFYLKHARDIILFGIALVVTLCSLGTVKKEMETPLFGQVGYNDVADFLVENDLTQGYALFWNSNVLREMSDGKIETWTIYSGENDSIYKWLQEVEHSTTKPQEPYFLFVNSKIGGGPENYAMLQDGQGVLVYEKEPFYIYVFDSALMGNDINSDGVK